MAFFDKLGDIARNIGDKATDAIETNKLNSKINAEKTAIAECMRQIGEYYYGKHQTGDPDDPAVAEIYAAIDGHNKAIADTQAEIIRIQEENSQQTEQAGVAETVIAVAPDYTAAGDIACPSCGKLNSAGTKFCCECGSKLEVPPPQPQERFCPECGTPVSSDNKFCGTCGHRFA